MTREEAKKMAEAKLKCMEREVSGIDKDCNNNRCDECPLNYEQGNMGEQKEWLRMAIQALEQESCDDVISRQAVIDRIRESIETYHNQYTTDMLNMWGLFTQFIKEMPSVKPQEPKTGHWIIMHDGEYYCDRCNCESPNNEKWNYCPICGAIMVKPKERSEE